MAASEGEVVENYISHRPESSLSGEVIAFLGTMPREGIIVHGSKLIYADDKTDNGIHYPSNVYTYIPKPDDSSLHDPKFLRRFVPKLRRIAEYSARVATTGSEEKIGHFGFSDRFHQLEDQYPYGYVPAKVFFNGEGKKLLPELIIARAPNPLYIDYINGGLKLDRDGFSVDVGAHKYAVPPENFLARISLSPEEFESELYPNHVLVQKTVDTLVEKWKDETLVQKAPLMRTLVKLLKRKLRKLSLELNGPKYPVGFEY